MNEWNAPGIRNAYDLDKKVASNASDEVNDRQSSSQSSGEMNTFSKDEIPHDVQGTNLGPQKPIMPTVTPSSIIFRSPYYTFPPFPDAGLSLSQAQAVNEKWYMKTLDNQFLYQEKNIELDKRYREKLINQAFSNKVEGFHSTKDVHNNIVPIPSKFDLNEFGNSFIQEHAIVKIRDRRQKDGILYMIRSEEYNRHVPMEPSELQKEYGFLLFDYELSDTQRKYAFHILSRKIPFLTQSPLKKLEDYQVMFKNGYYDLHNQTFFKIPSEERIKFYNEFSLEFDYIEEDTNPIVFEKMLSDMFDGDNIKIHLAYQYIGAFLTPVSTLRGFCKIHSKVIHKTKFEE